MSNFFYTGNAGVVFRATNGPIQKVGQVIPAGTILVQSDPMPLDITFWGVYTMDMIISCHGGTGPAVESGICVRFLRHPVTLVGGLILSTPQNSTVRINEFDSLIIQAGEYFSLILAFDTKADNIQGFMKYRQISML